MRTLTRVKLRPNSYQPSRSKSPTNHKGAPPVLVIIFRFLSHSAARLWLHLTDAIADKNMERAQEAKSAVEDAQRDLRKKRDERGEKHVPRFFAQGSDGRWSPKIQYVSLLTRSREFC
jgi:hypothetical protein